VCGRAPDGTHNECLTCRCEPAVSPSRVTALHDDGFSTFPSAREPQRPSEGLPTIGDCRPVIGRLICRARSQPCGVSCQTVLVGLQRLDLCSNGRFDRADARSDASLGRHVRKAPDVPMSATCSCRIISTPPESSMYRDAKPRKYDVIVEFRHVTGQQYH
jgi:hypothetical protein